MDFSRVALGVSGVLVNFPSKAVFLHLQRRFLAIP